MPADTLSGTSSNRFIYAADAVIKESRHGLDRSTCGGLRSWMRDLMFANIPSPKLDQIVEDMVTGR